MTLNPRYQRKQLLSPTDCPLASLAWLALAAARPSRLPHRRPDGKVTFSDRAPTVPAPTAPRAGAAAAAAMPPPCPMSCNQVARFPCHALHRNDCAALHHSARNLLINRGVPFTERTITTNEDIDALQADQRPSLPFGTIGGQQLQGFSDSDGPYLDAAGYPKSQLPQLPPPGAHPLVVSQTGGTATPPAPPPRHRRHAWRRHPRQASRRPTRPASSFRTVQNCSVRTLRRAEQADMGFWCENAHGDHARPLVDLALEGQRLGNR